MLLFKDVRVLHGKKTVLQQVYAHIEKEKLTVIIGKNGSGKTSLLHCPVGLTDYNGEILLDGKPLDGISARDRAKMLCLMPQKLPDTALTAEQLAFLGREPYVGLGKKHTPQDHAAVEQALELARVQELRNRPVNRLSGGERQRAFLAMAIAQDTPLLLFDEPTAHLDTDHANHFLQCIRSLVDTQHKTAVLVLHDLNQAMQFADNVLVTDGGTCIFSGTKEEFLKENLHQSIFGVQSTSVCDKNGQERILFYT